MKKRSNEIGLKEFLESRKELRRGIDLVVVVRHDKEYSTFGGERETKKSCVPEGKSVTIAKKIEDGSESKICHMCFPTNKALCSSFRYY